MGTGKKIGYVRVSSVDQNTARQLDAGELAAMGVKLDLVFTDKCSGKDTKRPELERCLQYLRGGDTLYVHSIDRLARSLKDLQPIVEDLNRKDLEAVGEGVTVVFVRNGLTFSGSAKASPADRLLLQLLGAVAEFERELIRERQLEGIAKAKAAGRYKGRKSKLRAADLDALQDLQDGGTSIAELGRRYAVSRQTVYKLLARRAAAAAGTVAPATQKTA